MPTWATRPDAVRHWSDAESLDDQRLDELLAVAHYECAEYAQPLAAGAAVPPNYMLAVVYQAREVFNAGKRDSADMIGVGDLVIRARPLTAAVKQLLPRRDPECA